MKKRKSQVLTDAKKFYKILLYNASGGNLGTEPEKKVTDNSITFAEKRGFLDSLIKIAQLEAKSNEGFEEESGFDKIRKDIYASRESERPGDTGGDTESGSYGDTGTSTEDDGASES